jgi:hypothetical protein
MQFIVLFTSCHSLDLPHVLETCSKSWQTVYAHEPSGEGQVLSIGIKLPFIFFFTSLIFYGQGTLAIPIPIPIPNSNSFQFTPALHPLDIAFFSTLTSTSGISLEWTGPIDFTCKKFQGSS